MAKLKKKRVRWNASSSIRVAGYKLYWALGGGVDYDAHSVVVGHVTQVILPDDVAEFPLVQGEVELGVTAMDETGNESDMTKLSASFNFVAPDPPLNLGVESMEDFSIDPISDDELVRLAKDSF